MNATPLKGQPVGLVWMLLAGSGACLVMFPTAVWALTAHSGYVASFAPRWVLGEIFGVVAWAVFWLAGLAMLPLAVAALLVARARAYGPLSAGCRVEPALAWLELSVGVSIWATFITAFLPAITAGLGMGRL